MMKDTIKKAVIPVFFLLLWCFPLINMLAKPYFFVFIACYCVSILCLLFIKNKFISLVSAMAVGLIAVIYHQEFLFPYVCPFFIIFEYIQLFKRKKESKENKKENESFLGVNASMILGIVALVYLYLNPYKGYTEDRPYILDNTQAAVWAMFVVWLVMVIICVSKKTQWKQISSNSGISMGMLKELRFIRFMDLICFIEAIVFYLFVNVQLAGETSKLFFLPWLIYFGLMIYYKDPILYEVISKIENIFIKLSGESA